MRRSALIVVIAIVPLALGAGWFLLSESTQTVVAESTEAVQRGGTGPLDGLTFKGALGPDGKPKDIADTFVFANGTFVSKECELKCKYPARPYFIRKNGEKTEFVSETKCPYKDAKIIWRGTVEGNTIKGVSTWTVRRWYWTVENKFEFAGELLNQSTPVAGDQ